MLTNDWTPYSAAASRTASVPRTLVLSASAGLRSSSGRCLSAAAWKTISGRNRSKTSATRRRSRMSASTVSSESSRARPSSDSWTACRADSSRSSMISWAGPSVCSWRQSSAPIDPPAPVTRTRLPADVLVHRRHVDAGRWPAEQVGDARVTHSLDPRPAGQQFHDRRDHLGNQPAALGRLGQIPDDPSAPPGDRDDQHPRPGARGHLGELGPATEDRDAVDPQPPLQRVVVQDGHRPVRRPGLGRQAADQLGARVPPPRTR